MKTFLRFVACLLPLVPLQAALRVVNLTNLPPAGALAAIAHGPTATIVVGSDGTIRRLTAMNGVLVAGDEFSPISLNSAAFGGGQFVAGGDEGRLFQSEAVDSWMELDRAITTPTRGPVQALIFSGERFVAAQSSGVIWVSRNQLPWEARVNNAFARFRALTAVTSQRLVAVGPSGTIFTSATGGENWTVRTAPNPQGNWFGVAATPTGRIVAVGAGGRAMTSSDFGATWLNVATGAPSDLLGITYTGARFFAVGREGRLLESATGASWTHFASGVAEDLNAISHAPEGTLLAGLTLAVGNSGQMFVLGDNPAAPTLDWTDLTNCFGGANYIVSAQSGPTVAVDWLNAEGATLLANSPTYTFTNPAAGSVTRVFARARDARIPDFAGIPREVKLTILASPTVRFSTASTNFLRSDPPFNLRNVLEVIPNVDGAYIGESFTFQGVRVDGILNPAVGPVYTTTNPIPNIVHFDYTNAVGCAARATIEIIVYDLPTLALQANAPTFFCVDEAPVNLAALFTVEPNAPAGGPGFSFAGVGVTNGMFYPSAIAGADPLRSVNISYSYINANGASAAVSGPLVLWIGDCRLQAALAGGAINLQWHGPLELYSTPSLVEAPWARLASGILGTNRLNFVPDQMGEFFRLQKPARVE